MKIFSLIFVLLFCTIHKTGKCNTVVDSVTFFHGTFSEVLIESKIQKKPIYIDIYTDWCVPCKAMAKQVFFNKEASYFLNKNFITFRINAEKGEGKSFAKGYKIAAYPTSIYMDNNGELLKRVEGYRNIASFMEDARSAYQLFNNNFTLSGLEKRYANGERGTDFLNIYLEKLATYKIRRENILVEYLNRFPKNDWLAEKNLRLVVEHLENFNNEVYRKFTDNLRMINKNHKEWRDLIFSFRLLQFEVINKTIAKAIQQHDEALMDTCAQVRYDLHKKMDNQTPIDSVEFINEKKLYYYHETKQDSIYALMAMKEVDRLMKISVDSVKQQDNKTYDSFLTYLSSIKDSTMRKNRMKAENDRMRARESNRISSKLNDFARNFYTITDDVDTLKQVLNWCKRANKYKRNAESTEISAAILNKIGQRGNAIDILRNEIDSGKSDVEIQAHLKKIIKVYEKNIK